MQGFADQKERLPVRDGEPGLEKMMLLSRRLQQYTRPPPVEELVEALRQFFAFRELSRTTCTDFQSKFLVDTLEYLLKQPPSQVADVTAKFDIGAALRTFSTSSTSQSVSLRIARLLYDLGQHISNPLNIPNIENQNRQLFIAALIKSKNIREAWGLAKEDQQTDLDRDIALQQQYDTSFYNKFLQAFANDTDEQGMVEVLDAMRNASVEITNSYRILVIRCYARSGKLKEMDAWYQDLPQMKDKHAALLGVVSDAAKKQQSVTIEPWVEEQFAGLESNTLSKDACDAIVLWAACTGKGANDIDRMIEILIRRTKDQNHNAQYRFSKTLRKSLLQIAIGRNDAYSAERFMHLGNGKYWGHSELTASEYLYQMQYRLLGGDIGGATEAFVHFQGLYDPTTNLIKSERFISIANQYLQRLCETPNQSWKQVERASQYFIENFVPFKADTVVSLAEIHIARDEVRDLIDLLKTHVFSLPIAGRQKVRHALVNFCVDPANDLARVWDVYLIINKLLEETPRLERVKMMQEFYRRRRPDLAVHVFGHLRYHYDPDIRANADTYAEAFYGSARCADTGSLEAIYNLLKVDTRVEPNTRIWNNLMLAYLACDRPERAMTIWLRIDESREGPSHSSLLLIFRAFEKFPADEDKLQEIWDRLRMMDVEIDRDILGAYIGALAAHQLAKEAMHQIDTSSTEYGFPADAFLYVRTSWCY
jgi:hypothetical protein